ncbi:hypothetical protein BZA77DRAFT_29654 [Pyronema omphalodes]|nr:hypothetical protein BZA77DRAFT_29654 [Pyronema omphalodes]
MYSCVNQPRGCRGRVNIPGGRCDSCRVSFSPILQSINSRKSTFLLKSPQLTQQFPLATKPSQTISIFRFPFRRIISSSIDRFQQPFTRSSGTTINSVLICFLCFIFDPTPPNHTTISLLYTYILSYPILSIISYPNLRIFSPARPDRQTYSTPIVASYIAPKHRRTDPSGELSERAKPASITYFRNI